jgi:hypothetical protein
MDGETTGQTVPAPAHAAPEGAGAPDGGSELFRWRSHPLKQGGRRLIWVVAVVVGMPAILTVLYGLFYGLLALVILGGSLGTYFLPTDYVLYSGGVESRFLGVARRFSWAQFRSLYRDRNGVLLSPFPRPSRLENFRGLYLRFDGCEHKVMAVVAERMAKEGGQTAPGNAASASREATT